MDARKRALGSIRPSPALAALHILLRPECAQRVLAKHVGVALARLGQFDDSLSESRVGVIGPVLRDRRARHFERDAHVLDIETVGGVQIGGMGMMRRPYRQTGAACVRYLT